MELFFEISDIAEEFPLHGTENTTKSLLVELVINPNSWIIKLDQGRSHIEENFNIVD